MAINTVITLDRATEAALVDALAASFALSGGTPYVPNAPFDTLPRGSAFAVPPLVAVAGEGGTTVMVGQQNQSVLFNEPTNRTQITLRLPAPPLDGQILTIGTARNITTLTIVPPVPTFPGGLAAGDEYQVKWYDALGIWTLLK